jgi:hypothetical protein
MDYNYRGGQAIFCNIETIIIEQDLREDASG